MAYAAYCESFNALHGNFIPAPTASPKKLMVLDVTVPSCQAFRARCLLAGCPQADVLRCIPRLRDRTVVLEIQLPADRFQDVMHVRMTSVPGGEMGALNSWHQHLSSHGMTHEL
ncbi:MAG: hypothetical protein H7238_10570 [Polaromonas sp.]|nr:hypothetical protein [Polaromonas sp.]